MSKYNFVSPGAAAGDAIERYLLQRQMQQRQAMLDQLGIAEKTHASAREDERVRLEGEAGARQADAHNLDLANAAAGSLGIGGRIDPTDPNAQNIEKYLPGVLDQDKTLQATHRVMTGVPGLMVQSNDVAPVETGQLVSRGTAGQKKDAEAIVAREREQEASLSARAEQAKAAQEAAAERAKDSDAMRLQIAQLGAEGKATSREIADQLKLLQAQKLQGDMDNAAKTKADAHTAAAATRKKIRDLAQGLIADPALKDITGPVEGRRDTFFQGQNVDALSRLNQLVNSLSVEERGKLKGQGAVSNFETEMLAKAVSSLNRAAGPDNTTKHLKEILQAFQGDTPADAAAAADPLGIR